MPSRLPSRSISETGGGAKMLCRPSGQVRGDLVDWESFRICARLLLGNCNCYLDAFFGGRSIAYKS